MNGDRDVKIVERYLEGDISYTNLAGVFKVSRSTIINVMKNATRIGAVTPRTPGQNIKNGG